jgi:hypothetical protein
MKLILFFLVFSTPLALASVNPVPPTPGNLHLGADETYSFSDGNFTAGGGGFSSLANGGKFQQYQTHLLGDYDFSAALRLRVHFSMTGVDANNSLYSRTNFHMDRLGLGGEYWTGFGRVPFIFYGNVSAPLYKPDLDAASDTAFGTDGAMNADFGVFVRPRFWGLLGKFGVGYLWRNEDLSHLIPWTAGATYILPVGQIGGGLRGYQTAVKDTSSAAERARRTTAIQNNQAGSLSYLSVDPSLQQFYVDSRWGITPALDFLTDASYDFNGSSTAKNFALSVGFRWILDFGGSGGLTDGIGNSRGGSAPANDFRIKNDSYQEELFDQADPTVHLRPKPKAKKRVKPQKSLDQLMNETEKSLEP